MLVSTLKIYPNTYRDSVELLQVAAEVQQTINGVKSVTAMMATPANHDMLLKGRNATDAERIKKADPNDMVVAVDATSQMAIDEALALIAKAMAGKVQKRGSAQASSVPTTVRLGTQAIAEIKEGAKANFLICSAPGTYAAAEAMKALKLGMNVFLFSDNVSVEEEAELKRLAVKKNLLVMGPDCGTAVIDGIPFAFANQCKQGCIGLVGASGTGLQEVSSLIDRLGEGISQMIGTGGRDLSDEVGGLMLLAGIDRLANDPGTSVLVLVSKPPSPAIAKAVYSRLQNVQKPTVIVFLGADEKNILEAGAVPATTLEDAATLAVSLARGEAPEPLRTKHFAIPDPKSKVAAGQHIEGLFSGGTFAKESALMLKALSSTHPELKEHRLYDLGEDQFCLGKPHPMIDTSTRAEWLVKAGKNPKVGVILIDVVIGYGSHADPAGALVPAIKKAVEIAKKDGRRLEIVGSVHGTETDLQGLGDQERKLRHAGVHLCNSNAAATRLAASMVLGKRLPDPHPYTMPKALAKVPASKPTRMYPDGVYALNLGLESFVEAPRKAGATVIHLDWKPPALGDRDVGLSLARMEDDDESDIGRAIGAANKEALRRIISGGAMVVDVKPAKEMLGVPPKTLLHAGPPIDWARMCGPMRGAMAGAAVFEGWASSVEEAEKMAARGDFRFAPCHHYNAVGPMAGVLSPSMPVFVVNNAKYNIKSYCSLNEGLGKVLRFGANSHEVIRRLQYMRDTLGPALSNVFKAHPLDAKALMAQALNMGDEVHNRNMAATSLFVRTIASPLLKTNTPDVARNVFDFLETNSHFFLNISMPASKAMLQAAQGIPNSSVVTVMTRNGVDFGIRLAGTGDTWFTAPAPTVNALYFPGYGPEDANLDMGDSSITETMGVGGFAMAAAPAIIKFVGGSAADATKQTRDMYKITVGRNAEFALAALDFAGTPTAIDARLVADSGIAPVINTGVAHKKAGVGQVGAGICQAPLSVFNKGLKELHSRIVSRSYHTAANRPSHLRMSVPASRAAPIVRRVAPLVRCAK